MCQILGGILDASDFLEDCQRHDDEQGLFLDAPDGLEDDHGNDEEEHPKEEAEQRQATLVCLRVTRI